MPVTEIEVITPASKIKVIVHPTEPAVAGMAPLPLAKPDNSPRIKFLREVAAATLERIVAAALDRFKF